MEKYRVRKRREAEFLAEAIAKGGGSLVDPIDGSMAPFEFRVATPRGEVVDLVVYAFHANKYRQGNRPPDEHRFQVKYGSEFDRYHEIYVDPTRRRVTLMLGVHLEAGILVAVDPVMHNPTRFSRSVEFKDEEVRQVLERGWFGWERDRSTSRRKRSLPLENQQTESLIGFTPDRLLDFIAFERLASGMDTGPRLLLAERMGRAAKHPLEREFELPAWRILNLVDDRFRLKVAVRGGVAEVHLERSLRATRGVEGLRLPDKDGEPDFSLFYEGRGPIQIECKNVGRRKVRGLPKVDFQKTRASKQDPCSRYYRASDFHILAACLFPVSETWEFGFRETEGLGAHRKCKGRLTPNVFVEDDWPRSTAEILARVSSKLVK